MTTIELNYATGGGDSPLVLSVPEERRGEVLALLDPAGELRRAGRVDTQAIPVVVSSHQWTPRTPEVHFRVWRDRLYRRELDPRAFAGCRVQYVWLTNERLVREWLRG